MNIINLYADYITPQERRVLELIQAINDDPNLHSSSAVNNLAYELSLNLLATFSERVKEGKSTVVPIVPESVPDDSDKLALMKLEDDFRQLKAEVAELKLRVPSCYPHPYPILPWTYPACDSGLLTRDTAGNYEIQYPADATGSVSIPPGHEVVTAQWPADQTGYNNPLIKAEKLMDYYASRAIGTTLDTSAPTPTPLEEALALPRTVPATDFIPQHELSRPSRRDRELPMTPATEKSLDEVLADNDPSLPYTSSRPVRDDATIANSKNGFVPVHDGKFAIPVLGMSVITTTTPLTEPTIKGSTTNE